MKLKAGVVGLVSVESDGHEWQEGSGSEQVGALDLVVSKVFYDWPRPPHDPGFASHPPFPPTSVYLWANSFTSLVPVSSVLGVVVLGEFCYFVGNKFPHPSII